jgi:hypothetical protein
VKSTTKLSTSTIGVFVVVSFLSNTSFMLLPPR